MRPILFMALLALLHGCAAGVAAGYGQGGRNADGRTYQESEADNRITAAVNSALVHEQLPALAIEVTTRDGVVTLRGRVPNRRTAQRAVEIARSVSGVTAVRDQLRIAQ